MRYFLMPDEVLKSVYDIDVHRLWGQGFRFMLLDLDNTLLPWNTYFVRGELKEWFKKVRAVGFTCVIVSNNSHVRIAPVASELDVPFVENAGKPFRSSIARAMNLIGAPREQTLMVGDQLITDILAGKSAKLYTILVSPISEKEHKGTKINRLVERMLLDGMGIKRP